MSIQYARPIMQSSRESGGPGQPLVARPGFPLTRGWRFYLKEQLQGRERRRRFGVANEIDRLQQKGLVFQDGRGYISLVLPQQPPTPTM